MTLKRNLYNPKIYSANGDLKNRWDVYFSFRDPECGKLKRLTPFYSVGNTYKTKEDRLEDLIVYRKALLKLLRQGYNPFSGNTELLHKLHSKSDSQNSVELTKLFDSHLTLKRLL